LLYSIVVLRLLVPVLFAACVAPGLSTYNDTDPAIENGGSGGGSCTATAFTVTPVTPYIQLVVDGSGTMFQETINGTQKFQAVQKALVQTSSPAGALVALQNKAMFGASVFTSEQCPKLYAAPCTLGNLAGITTALSDGSQSQGLFDPLDKAISAVATNLAAAPAGSKKYIVLATDGVSNSCNSNQDSPAAGLAAVTAAYATNNITTYIIGLGNADGDGAWTGFQSDIANAGAGGTGTPYAANSLADLTTAYTTIFNLVLDCELTLDGTIDVAQASLGTVKLNGTALVYTTDWTAVDEHTIKLVGQKCIDYNSAVTTPEITATFTCGSSN
jgi:hypothetical protein